LCYNILVMEKKIEIRDTGKYEKGVFVGEDIL
jgi:hypothetical protein